MVTNQAGIGKGLYGHEDYRAVMDHLREGVAKIGGWIDDVRYCPDHPEAVVEAHRRTSDWRKPAPGMLLDLMRQWPVDAARSLIASGQIDEAIVVGVELSNHSTLAGFAAMELLSRTTCQPFDASTWSSGSIWIASQAISPTIFQAEVQNHKPTLSAWKA